MADTGKNNKEGACRVVLPLTGTGVTWKEGMEGSTVRRKLPTQIMNIYRGSLTINTKAQQISLASVSDQREDREEGSRFGLQFSFHLIRVKGGIDCVF